MTLRPHRRFRCGGMVMQIGHFLNVTALARKAPTINPRSPVAHATNPRSLKLEEVKGPSVSHIIVTRSPVQIAATAVPSSKPLLRFTFISLLRNNKDHRPRAIRSRQQTEIPPRGLVHSLVRRSGKFFQDGLRKKLVDLAVTGDRLRHSSAGVLIPIVFPSMSNENAPQFLYFLYEVSAFHATSNSATFRTAGMCPPDKSAYRSRRCS